MNALKLSDGHKRSLNFADGSGRNKTKSPVAAASRRTNLSSSMNFMPGALAAKNDRISDEMGLQYSHDCTANFFN